MNNNERYRILSIEVGGSVKGIKKIQNESIFSALEEFGVVVVAGDRNTLSIEYDKLLLFIDKEKEDFNGFYSGTDLDKLKGNIVKIFKKLEKLLGKEIECYVTKIVAESKLNHNTDEIINSLINKQFLSELKKKDKKFSDIVVSGIRLSTTVDECKQLKPGGVCSPDIIIDKSISEKKDYVGYCVQCENIEIAYNIIKNMDEGVRGDG
jgi:hypothetical protein